MNHAQFWGGGGAAPYEIEQSLRFDGSSHLEWTPSTSGNGNSWTVSLWYKFQYPSYRPGGIQFFQSDGTNHTNVYTYAANVAPDDGKIYMLLGGGGSPYNRTQSNMRDPSAWYHLVVVYDGADGTAQQRQRFYINGVQQPTDSPGNPPDGRTTTWMQNVKHKISTDTTEKFYGYMAEFHAVDGQQLLPTDFGEFDDNGVWRPIRYTGSYGTNGFYLKFDPSATNGIGHDHSGNGNNFTPSGFDTTNTTAATYDVMSDTPTTNWCTLNPLDSGGGTLTNGNLDASYPSHKTTRATLGVSTGKWYWEVSPDATSLLGIATAQATLASYVGSDSYGWGIYSNGYKYTGGSGVSYGSSFTSGDIIGVALDLDAGTLVFYKNGVSQGAAFTGLAGGPYFPAIGHQDMDASINFGQRDFEYTPPTGFNALNTANLPAPDIADGSQHFNTVLYTGNSGTQSITGVGFQPDFVWAKSRVEGYSHYLFDVARGAGVYLNTNNTNAEYSDITTLSSFDTDGFSLGSPPGTNNNTKNYVAWNWLAGGSGSSNTAGSITSTVSANPSAGFSIVTYTGTGANATVGHGLGVAPKMFITKSRDGGSWGVYHASIGANYILYLDLTDAAFSNVYAWNNTAPTSTVFTVSQSDACNTLNEDYVAYCFAEVESYSKIGSYVGNGSSDGPFVYCGHKVAWVMIKNTAGTVDSWYISDNKRNTYNVVNGRLLANAANSESTSVDICDFTANGFKIRTNDSGWNTSGSTYIFMALAENPFGGDGVSPATAR